MSWGRSHRQERMSLRVEGVGWYSQVISANFSSEAQITGSLREDGLNRKLVSWTSLLLHAPEGPTFSSQGMFCPPSPCARWVGVGVQRCTQSATFSKTEARSLRTAAIMLGSEWWCRLADAEANAEAFAAMPCGTGVGKVFLYGDKHGIGSRENHRSLQAKSSIAAKRTWSHDKDYVALKLA